MKITFLILVLLPFTAFGGSIHCTSNLTTETVPLEIGQFQSAVHDFKGNLSFTQKIQGTEFSYTVVTGLTRDLMDDPDKPIFIGKPTLVSLVIFNESKSQIARFDSYPLEPQNIINLTAGSSPPSSLLRIHVACKLK